MIGKICSFCEEVFDQNMIADHIGIEHFESQNNVTACKDCDKKFTSQSELKIHRNIVHPSFKFACENSEVRFLSESSLNLTNIHFEHFEIIFLTFFNTFCVLHCKIKWVWRNLKISKIANLMQNAKQMQNAKKKNAKQMQN